MYEYDSGSIFSYIHIWVNDSYMGMISDNSCMSVIYSRHHCAVYIHYIIVYDIVHITFNYL